MFTVNDIGKNYKKKMVLNHISLQVAPGECIGLLGINGSGKSTLAGLAARLYDASEGEVLIDGKNVKDYSFRGLYDKMGYDQQDNGNDDGGRKQLE